MAFNPFSGFQKNQKFWMAGVLLLCMITFVFCTGAGSGDLGDRMLRLIGRRGTTLASVGGYNLTSTDLHQLRAQRNMVNDFMRKCADIAVHNLNEEIKKQSTPQAGGDPKKDEGRQKALGDLLSRQDVLMEKLRKARFFEGGAKFDDLIEFKTWQAQADRLGIQLLEKDVEIMFYNDLLGAILPHQVDAARHDTRGAFRESTLSVVQALTEEYRVRIARLALYEMQAFSYYARRNEGANPKLSYSGLPDQMRNPMTLAQLWDVYKEKRAEFDVTLIPVHVADFKDKVGAPNDVELENFFNRFKAERFDPQSPTPGFEIPQKAKVEFVMADPSSPAYVNRAQAKMLLETLSPLNALAGQSPVIVAARYAALAEAEQASLQRTYESLSQVQYRTVGYPEQNYVTPISAWLARRQPAAAAALVGALGNAAAGDGTLPILDAVVAQTAYVASGSVRQPEAFRAGVAAEERRRAPVLAKLAGVAATGEPYAFLSAVTAVDPFAARENMLTLPLSVVRQDIEDILARRTAESWAGSVMQKLKRELEKNTKPEAVERTLNKFLKQYELTHVKTDQFIDRFTAADAKALAPLRESYLKYMDQINWFEGRDLTPERLLKEGDFHKLFFDTERFSTTSNFQIRPWPPAIMPNPVQMRQQMGMPFQRLPDIAPELMEDVHRAMQGQDPTRPSASYELFTKAEKPVLFWKTETKPAEYPEKLAQVKDRAVEAWRLQKAREAKALPLAKKIAEELEKSGGDFTTNVIARAAEQAGSKPVSVNGLSAWHGNRTGFKRDYTDYPLPKGLFTFPREDMVADLLRLPELKKPIEIKVRDKDGTEPAAVKELNELNKFLFNRAPKKDNLGQFVQVLTNKPQTTYYVAVVTQKPHAERGDFIAAVVNAPLSREMFLDSFLQRAQSEEAREFRAQLLEQMRRDLGYWVNEDATEERKSFENDVGA